MLADNGIVFWRKNVTSVHWRGKKSPKKPKPHTHPQDKINLDLQLGYWTPLVVVRAVSEIIAATIDAQTE